MKVFQSIFKNDSWQSSMPENNPSQLVLAFGDRELIQQERITQELNSAFPSAEIIGCTTSGEIHNTELHENSISLTAIEFDQTAIHIVDKNATDFPCSEELGRSLITELPKDDLRHVFVLSDGQIVNGSDLVSGINGLLPEGVMATGGLAGDCFNFNQTMVWRNNSVCEGKVVLVGFYGDAIEVGHGHLGGWKPFGPERCITKSDANVLYEIDGQPALKLYESFLGKYAAELPASALLFPLAITLPNEEEAVVRTILSVDKDNQSMTFAGNMPEGATCQLMRANYENLVDGAHGAANTALNQFADIRPELAILISCVGRRIVLDQLTEEELEVVAEVVGGCPMSGFYSYGEISPMLDLGRCGLHNQTMTITLLSEKI